MNVPGTAAALNPEPRVVSLARRLADEGIDRDEGVRRLLEQGLSLSEMQAARTYWLRRVPWAGETWDDFRPTRALAMLDGAVAVLHG